MNKDEYYMNRCLELGEKALLNVAHNPMVGCVIVYNDRIIGEGYHEFYGKEHAEVNAINSVQDKELLKNATLYVNLEPCSHFGKTPPCADLIIKYHIPKVIIGCTDTNSLVSGQGIEKLKQAGIAVTTGILEDRSRELNKRFFTHHEKKRPYIILKWAQTANGFIDSIRKPADQTQPLKISNDNSLQLVHQWRSMEQAILVGTNTVVLDNPKLTVRLTNGKNPLRVTIDRFLRIPPTYHLLDKTTPTLIFTENKTAVEHNLEYIAIDFDIPVIPQLLKELHKRNIRSLFVEGGALLLNSFINNNLWDEAHIFVSNKKIETGINAPVLTAFPVSIEDSEGDELRNYRNQSAAALTD